MYGLWDNRESFDSWHARAMAKHKIPQRGADSWTRPLQHVDGRIIAALNGEAHDRVLTSDEYAEFMLSLTRQRLQEEVDGGTQELISHGFEFNGERFSLSPRSNIIKNGLRHLLPQLGNEIPLPLYWNTLDDQKRVALNTVEEVSGFWIKAVGTMRYHITMATDIKEGIRHASADDLAMWEDPRFQN